MIPSLLLALAALGGLLSVALGAFGAHALRDRLTEQQRGTFETAVNYQMTHSLAMAVCVVFHADFQVDLLLWAGFSFAIGIVLFSGSLYGLVLTGNRLFGPVTPVGGVAFLIGWLLLLSTAVSRL